MVYDIETTVNKLMSMIDMEDLSEIIIEESSRLYKSIVESFFNKVVAEDLEVPSDFVDEVTSGTLAKLIADNVAAPMEVLTYLVESDHHDVAEKWMPDDYTFEIVGVKINHEEHDVSWNIIGGKGDAESLISEVVENVIGDFTSGSSSGGFRDSTGEGGRESKTGRVRDTGNELDQLLDDALDMAKDMILRMASDILFGSDSRSRKKS
ncbi:hypothetical protein [Methanopyrus sp. KOL6]|uniref:hypothetical protein n=1 Tax=Methanopyrus sp. KOL6 TaxID=1937004 RepID=UPI000B4B3133|nr:hypothetical protein [Methanopyrus sp. KOL6]